MRNKAQSYIGFARRSGNLIGGSGACLAAIKKGKVRLLLLAADLAERSREKPVRAAEASGIPWRFYSTKEALSRLTGSEGRGVFAVTDPRFAELIAAEIDKEQEKKQ